MNRKKIGTLFLAGAMALSAFCGCAQGNDNEDHSTGTAEAGQKEVTIKFASWSSGDASTKDAFAGMFEDYKAKNPGVEIEDICIPYTQFLEQLLVMTSGGNAPDAAQIHGSMISALVSSGALTPLDELISQDVKDDFLENALKPLIYDGKMMATPWAPSPDVLYYNKTLLKKAGYDAPPTTWDEMKKMAADVAALGTDENGNKVYGYCIYTKKEAGSGYCFLPLIWANDGDLVDAEGNVTLNTPEVTAALTEAKQMIANEVSPSGLSMSDARNLFAQGQLAFIFDGDYGFTSFSQGSPKGEAFLEEIDAATPPEKMSVFYEHDLGVFEASAIKEQAADFISYLSGPEAMKIYNDNGGNKTPGRKSVRELDYYNEDNTQIQVFLDTLDVSRGFPQQNAGFIKAMEDLAEGLQKISINNEDPADVAKTLNDEITALYNENK